VNGFLSYIHDRASKWESFVHRIVPVTKAPWQRKTNAAKNERKYQPNAAAAEN
jgi:hypothetical protein